MDGEFRASRCLAAALADQARQAGHRRALLLAGEPEWGWRAAAAIWAELAPARALWVGAAAPPGIEPLASRAAGQWLGRELDGLVWDAHAGLDPDALGALAGTLCAGALLLLVTPPLAVWLRPGDPDPPRSGLELDEAPPGRFLRRWARLLDVARGLVRLEQGRPPPALPEPGPPPPRLAATPPCRTQDQERAVAAIVQLAGGRRRRPLVLVSDRGRGKSSALGLAAAWLIRERGLRILLTGPRLAAVQPALDQAAAQLPEARRGAGHLLLDRGGLEFAPPDDLALQPRPADLLMIDEAAALPAPLLERLLTAYPRLLFSTTNRGYEGTGRGFEVRFRATLERLAPGWRRLELTTPIRWSAWDPLERLIDRLLLLDAEPAPDSALADLDPAACRCRWLDRDLLAADDRLLGQLFGLLILAHYRTTPGDLRQLLDGAGVRVLVSERGAELVGAVLLVSEGGLEPALAGLIAAGRRRVPGHLLPQTLSQHVGLGDAPLTRGWRLVRVAVHPAARRLGLGSALIREVLASAGAAGLDWAGSSFGANLDLTRFWARSGLMPVRLGLTRGASSGAYSLAVLAPLSPAGMDLYQRARERFHAHLPHMLADGLTNLEADLAAWLLEGDDRALQAHFTAQDWRDLESLAFGSRCQETCPAPVWALARAALAVPAPTSGLDALARALLVVRVLQKRSWSETATRLGLSGRAAGEAALRSAVAVLLPRLRAGWERPSGPVTGDQD